MFESCSGQTFSFFLFFSNWKLLFIIIFLFALLLAFRIHGLAHLEAFDL